MKKFFIETYGCQMNKADSEAMTVQLKQAGYCETGDCNEADVIIVNTCSVRQTAENRIWGRLGFFKKLKSDTAATIVVVGCMSQRLGDEIIKQDNTVDIVVGTYYKNSIPRILDNHTHGEKLVFVEEQALTFFESMPESVNPAKAFVTISHGCNNYCTYCIVPYLRGPEQSRPSRDIIKDIERLYHLGVKQVTLLGQNVNSYGHDTGDCTFSELLNKICRKTSMPWIKFLSSHPRDFSNDLIEVMKEQERVCNWLHLAIQSGSDPVLERMNRSYRIETVYRQIEKLRKAIPGVNLTTGYTGRISRRDRRAVHGNFPDGERLTV
jgi:tRNA-2-methylthio-N6-dimethylallyladenosine synthase